MKNNSSLLTVSKFACFLVNCEISWLAHYSVNTIEEEYLQRKSRVNPIILILFTGYGGWIPAIFPIYIISRWYACTYTGMMHSAVKIERLITGIWPDVRLRAPSVPRELAGYWLPRGNVTKHNCPRHSCPPGSLTASLTHSPPGSLTASLTHSPPGSLTASLTHSPPGSLTASLTHSPPGSLHPSLIPHQAHLLHPSLGPPSLIPHQAHLLHPSLGPPSLIPHQAHLLHPSLGPPLLIPHQAHLLHPSLGPPLFIPHQAHLLHPSLGPPLFIPHQAHLLHPSHLALLTHSPSGSLTASLTWSFPHSFPTRITMFIPHLSSLTWSSLPHSPPGSSHTYPNQAHLAHPSFAPFSPPCGDFSLYLVEAQALLGLDVERVPRQLRPRHLQDHVALLQRSTRWCSRSGHRGKLQRK